MHPTGHTLSCITCGHLPVNNAMLMYDTFRFAVVFFWKCIRMEQKPVYICSLSGCWTERNLSFQMKFLLHVSEKEQNEKRTNCLWLLNYISPLIDSSFGKCQRWGYEVGGSCVVFPERELKNNPRSNDQQQLRAIKDLGDWGPFW